MMNLKQRIKNARFASDFDSTVTQQNAFVLLTKLLLKHHSKKWDVHKIVRQAPKILYYRSKFIAINRFDKYLNKPHGNDEDIYKSKVRLLKGVPYSIFEEEIVPMLRINPMFIRKFLQFRELFKFKKEDILLVSKNGIDEINSFLDYSSENNINRYLLPKEEFRDKNVSNREILTHLGINFIPVCNKLGKQEMVSGNKKYLAYNGRMTKNFDYFIDKKSKIRLYKDRIVFGDNEDAIYGSIPLAFINVQINSKNEKKLRNYLQKNKLINKQDNS